MPGARRTRKGQTKVNPSAQIRDPKSAGGGGPDRYDGRTNTNAGRTDKGPAVPKEILKHGNATGIIAHSDR